MEISEFAKLAILIVCLFAVYPICIITGESIKDYSKKGVYKNDMVRNARGHTKG